MKRYFKIPLEFDSNKLEKIIENTSLNSKGYCCFIDSNLLVEANKPFRNELFNVLNNSLINSCDGSYIALLASFIHKQKLQAYNGPEFFKKFIYSPDIHCIVGNTPAVFKKIKQKVALNGSVSNLYHIPLPYYENDQFDYQEIAEKINEINPRYIWVSLGAPKQEIFMYRLMPFLNKGVMLGVGAALNYFSGEIKDIPYWISKSHLIWLFRLLTEPKKQIKRIIKIIRYYPKIFFLETKSF